jgi:multidrug efflux pump subunit AcrA (membrane-fusion protein)
MAANLTVSPATPAPHDASTGFLELAPPHWAARGLAWVIIITILLGALAAVVIKLPETVTAAFVLVPVRGADPIKAQREGIVAHVFTQEGQTINQGDVIATVRSESAGERAAELATVQTQLAGTGESFGNAKAKFETERLSDEQEVRRLTARAEHLESLSAHKRRQLALTKQMADSFEQLYREGIASQAQLNGKQIEVSELTAEVERLVAEQRDVRAEIEKLRLASSARQTDFREVERKFKEATQTNGIRATALQAALPNTAGNEVRLIAPCAGTVLKLRVKDAGAIVHAGDTVAEMACANEALQAELSVPETGIGKLKIEQGVKLKYDAFPYQRHGVKYGRLSWLSPARGEDDSSGSFKARAELADKEVLLNGKPHRLAPGMRGQAEIVIGKRSLVSYVLEPLRQLQENFADVPPQTTARH